MCAIFGFINTEISPQKSETVLMNMAQSLAHRGPDGRGIDIGEGCAYGHNRLAVMDESAPNQPLKDPSGRVSVCFAGEIYNTKELKDLLAGEASHLKTRCDAELIPLLYCKFGIDFAKKLDGQFSIFIHDKSEDVFYLIRDRSGILPLYYAAGKEFLFASEAKALFASELVEPRLNINALDSLYTRWALPAGTTLFEGVEEVLPGHYLEVKNGKITQTGYWEAPSGDRADSIEHLSQELLCLMKKSVIDRLSGDKLPGLYLSGGVDSALIAALIPEETRPHIPVFILKGAEDEPSQWADALAQKMGYSRIINVPVSGSSSVIRDAVWHAESPMLRGAPAAFYLLAEHVSRTGVKSVISGEGADEYFFGYEIYKEAKLRQFWARAGQDSKRGDLTSRLYRYMPLMKESPKPVLRQLFSQKLGDVKDPYYSHLIRWETSARIRNFYGEKMTALKEVQDFLSQSIRRRLDAMPLLQRCRELEVSYFLHGFLLSVQGDRMSMANGIEMRQPYLNHEVIEWACSLDPKVHLSAFKDKRILRSVAGDLMGEELAVRAKAPFRHHISDFGAEGESMLDPVLTKKKGYFNSDAVETLNRKRKQSKKLSESEKTLLTAVVTTHLFDELFLK